MNYQVINTPLSDKTFSNRHYCLSFKGAYVKHKDFEMIKGIGRGWLEVVHEGLELELDNTDSQRAGRHDLIYNQNKPNNDLYFDELIDKDIFLFYDPAGLNYAHFFFNLFSKILYYEKLSIPNLTIGIPEDFYQEEGNSNFIKQWLDLYLKDKPIDIIVFKKHIRYKISNLIIPNVQYCFPEPIGEGLILDKIKEIANKIPIIKTNSKGCYISRQDTLKRGWYHKRELLNEIELIDQIQSKLGYDIIELMDYNMIQKIQTFKSYKNIIQQSSASAIGIIFSGKENTNIIISHPKMEGWFNSKLINFSSYSGAPLYTLNGGGECVENLDPNLIDQNNLPWELYDINSIIEVLLNLELN